MERGSWIELNVVWQNNEDAFFKNEQQQVWSSRIYNIALGMVLVDNDAVNVFVGIYSI